MSINYSGSYDDVKYDDLLTLTGYTTSHKFLRIRYYIFVAGIFFLVLAVIGSLFKSSELSFTFGFLCGVSFFIAIILSLLNAVQRRKKIAIKGSVTGQISETGNTMVIKNTRMSIKWDGYDSYALSEDLLLLVRKGDPQLIPRSFFVSADDWDTAISLTKSKLPEIEIKKPGWGTWLLVIMAMIISAVFGIYSFLSN